MTVLIIKNISHEGPENIQRFLERNKFPFDVIDLSKGDEIPPSEDYSHLVLLGGPMSANDTDKLSYLSDEMVLIKKFINQNKKVLGICLGAQLIAKSLGSKIYKGDVPELGWYPITLEESALSDPAFSSLFKDTLFKGAQLTVFHLHGETFTLPANSRWLASSSQYKHQAFAYKENVYGLQFHIEASQETILEWAKLEKLDLEKIKQDTNLHYKDCKTRGDLFFQEFFAS